MSNQKKREASFESKRLSAMLSGGFAHCLKSLCLLFMLALLAGGALAQGAADGFDPNVNGAIFAITVQSSGKVIIGGNFTSVNGVARNNLARLNPNGTLDTAFTTEADGAVTALAQQANGSILLGGVFNFVNGQTRHGLARMSAGGAVDSFNPNPNGAISSLAVQQDGKILVGGGFTTMGNLSAQRIARLLANGDQDEEFIASLNDGSVQDLDIQKDGQIVIGGTFTSVNGQTRNHLARLNHRGGLDQSFNPNVDGLVYAVRVLPGGRIVFGGNFTMVGAQTRNRLARVNDDGSLDAGFNPNLNANASVLTVQPDGSFLVGGTFTNAGGQVRNHLARFRLDGSLDQAFAGLINDVVGTIAMQPDGKIVIGGSFTAVNLQTRNHLARLYPTTGALDSDVNAATDGTVYAVALQPDGKILIGGDFTQVAGQTRNRIARLNADGSLDGSFNPNANAVVYAITLQADGKILVGGNFAGIGGGLHPALARLNANGTLDAGFTAGANNQVYAIAVQTDGKVVIGGAFDTIGGVTRNHLARLDTSGMLDGNFAPNVNGTVRALALQPNGQIVIGGGFTSVAGSARNFIARLNSAFGTVDAQFNPGASNQVHALAVMPGGEILVGGAFTTLGGQSHNHIGRLNSSGTIDASFTLSANDTVNCFAEQMNSRVLVGGDFTQFGGQTRNHLARFTFDGQLDSLDALMTGTTVNGLAVQLDGKIVIGGAYTLIGGQTRSNIGRYHSNEFVTQTLSVNDIGTQIDWTFIGAAPAFDHVEFELSTNGVDFSPLVAATSVSGGWRATGLSLQPLVNFYVRARGSYSSGLANGSGSIAESVYAAYLIPCFFDVSPTAATYGSGGGTFSLDVTAFNQACNWTVQSNAAWLTPAVFSGTGSQTVGYMLAANPGSQRTSTMTVAGQTVTITQLGASCANITINPPSIPAGTLGQPYNQPLTLVGSAGPYQFTLFGSLPAGLTLNQSTGVISGTPLATGLFQFQVGVHDIGCGEGLRAYNLNITNGGGGGGNAGLQFYALERPVRILDTRAGQGNCDNISSPISGGTSLSTFARLTCEGISIPANAQAIVGNVTVINQTNQNGYLTIYPDGVPAPLAANMIYGPGGILANNFTVGLGANGNFDIFAEKTLDAIVDISGYYAPPAVDGLYYHPLSKPVRLLDTRAGQGNCDNVNTPINAGTSLTTLARKTCDGLTIPAAAQAIVGNATVLNGSGQVGYLTIYPEGVAAPLAANLVYFPGQILANAFTVSLSAGGEFNIFGEKTIDMVIDVAGYYSNEAVDANGAGLLFTPLATPVRLLDTRAGFGNCDSVNAPIAAGSSLTKLARMTCEGQVIPNNAQSIIGNVTVINGTNQAGYLTLYPTGQAAPLAANMIYQPSQILSNAFVVGLNGSGQFNLFAERTLDAIVDVSGFFAP